MLAVNRVTNIPIRLPPSSRFVDTASTTLCMSLKAVVSDAMRPCIHIGSDAEADYGMQGRYASRAADSV